MKRNVFLWVVVAFALILCSCKKEYKNAIPSNSLLVAEVNLANVAYKAGLNEKKDAIKQALMPLFENEEEKDDISEIISDPLAFGIDFLNPAYCFMLPQLDDPQAFLLFAVRDLKKVKEAFMDGDECEVVESEGLNWIYLEGSLVGAVSKTTLLIGNSGNRTAYKELLEQDKSSSFFATDNGKVFKSNIGDLTVFANLQVLPQDIKNRLRGEIEKALRSNDISLPQSARLLDAAFASTLLLNMQFEKGLVKSKALVSGEITEFSKNKPAKAIDSKSMQYVSENNLLGLVACGIDGVAYWNYVKETIQSMAGMYGLSADVVSTIENFINQLNGTAVMAVSARSLNEDDFKVMCGLPVAKAEMLNTLNAIQPGLADQLNSAVAFEGNSELTVISSDKNYAFEPAQKSFKNTDKAQGQNMYVYLNAEYLTDLAYAEEINDSPYGLSRSEEQVFDWLRLLKYAEVKSDKADECLVEVALQNDKKNSLDVIVEKGLSYLR